LQIKDKSNSNKPKAGGRIFYGWWLLAAGTVVMIMQGGLYAYGFSAFFVPLAATLGTSRGVLSLAFSFTRLESSLLGPIEGYVIDRFGPRGIMYIGFAIFGLSFFMFSRVNSLFGFYMVFPLIALGASMSGFLPVVTAINNWFSKRRGLATGISSAGVNVGGILVALVALNISHFGWRTAAVIIAVIICVLGFPMSAMMRHKPQDYGYHPDGIDSQATNKNDSHKSDGNQTDEADPDFTAMQALRTPAFWFIAAAHGFSLFIVGSISIHQIPLLVDVGISYEQSASILAFMTFMAMIGRIGGGYLGDVFGRKSILVICFFMMSAGVIILAMAQNILQALVYAVIYGIGYGARAPILIALRGEFFGPRNFATIMGLSQPIMVIGSFFGPIAAGFAYDIQGNYRMIFTVIAAINLVGALLVFFIEKPKPPSTSDTNPQSI
tara:strand:+ start:130 stop:1443 length:1314 start_codon:yes stop_codon:yes gene_type:complete